MNRRRRHCMPTHEVVVAAIVLAVLISSDIVLGLSQQNVYRYFGYGSNVIPSTMKVLRQIEIREATAAILPDYELVFSSAAFVRPSPGNAVHGTLYTLTEDEFARVGSSEGVPLAYKWQKCRLYPYRGDGEEAGETASSNTEPVSAYTLIGLLDSDQTIVRPPSESYLGLIREGAKLWKFDKGYRDALETIPTATPKNPFFPKGWEGPTLELAEIATGTKRTYMIDGCE